MSNLFKNLSKLIKLKISYTSIKYLPIKAFERSKNLIELDLSNNKIEQIDIATFENLNSLIELNLNHNHIKALPSFVFSKLNKQLKVLDLSFNQISLLENKNFGNLTALRALNLAGNNLNNLTHNVIYKMENLIILNLSRNALDSLDEEFFNKIPNVEIIDLSHNNLVNLNQKYFESLTRLRSLNLSSNYLEILGDNQFSSLNLELLDLSRNSIVEISKLAFNNFRCIELKLSNNTLMDINQLNVALSIISLESLDLSFTNIRDSDLNIERFKEQAHTLKSLNLSNNLLTYLPRLPNFIKIQELDFSSNKIRTLNKSQIYIPEYYDKLKKHQTSMYLQENPFSCFKCDLEALIIYTKLNLKCSENDYYCVKCHEPFVLKGSNVRGLNATDLTSCGLPQKLTRFYQSIKPNFNFKTLIIIVVIVVILSIFAFLLVLYRRKVFSGIYYTREPKLDALSFAENELELSSSKKNLSKEIVSRNIQQISTLKKEIENFYQNKQRKSTFRSTDLSSYDENLKSEMSFKNKKSIESTVSFKEPNKDDDDLKNNNRTEFRKQSPETLDNVDELEDLNDINDDSMVVNGIEDSNQKLIDKAENSHSSSDKVKSNVNSTENSIEDKLT